MYPFAMISTTFDVLLKAIANLHYLPNLSIVLCVDGMIYFYDTPFLI